MCVGARGCECWVHSWSLLRRSSKARSRVGVWVESANCRPISELLSSRWSCAWCMQRARSVQAGGSGMSHDGKGRGAAMVRNCLIGPAPAKRAGARRLHPTFQLSARLCTTTQLSSRAHSTDCRHCSPVCLHLSVVFGILHLDLHFLGASSPSLCTIISRTITT